MKRIDYLHLTTGESLLFINVSTLKSVLAGLMGTELQHVLEEGWSAAWCYDNRARNLLPTKAKRQRKRARKKDIQGQAEAQEVAVLMPGRW